MCLQYFSWRKTYKQVQLAILQHTTPSFIPPMAPFPSTVLFLFPYLHTAPCLEAAQPRHATASGDIPFQPEHFKRILWSPNLATESQFLGSVLKCSSMAENIKDCVSRFWLPISSTLPAPSRFHNWENLFC